MNKRPLLVLLLIFSLFTYTSSINPKTRDNKESEVIDSTTAQPKYYPLYKELNLEKELSFQAFHQAMIGYEQLKPDKPILTLIDFSKASTEERFYVFNMKEKRLLFRTVVAHGKNSGANYTTSFSNKPGSNQSSLGFFMTEKTYIGSNGYSLVIDGLEKDINDNAKKRAVVIHGAEYANPQYAKKNGRLGRSWGCPALPRDVNKEIIDTIKEGSLIYAYSESHNNDYLKRSQVLTSN